MSKLRASDIIRQLRLEPLPVEGGMYRRTWHSQQTIDQKPAGTCIFALFTSDTDSFSAMHRLPDDEIWHFYAGDPIDLLLLHPNGSSEHIIFGPDILSGHSCQAIVPAGSWMGASLMPGGEFALFGCTMSPGFVPESYDGGERNSLIAQYPAERVAITRLTRPGAPTQRMPAGY